MGRFRRIVPGLVMALALLSSAAPAARPIAAQGVIALAVDPVVGPPGTVVHYTGVGFTPGRRVAILLIRGLGLVLDEAVAGPTGVVSGTFTMPAPGQVAELLFGRVYPVAAEVGTGRETAPAPFLLTRDAALDYPLPNGRFYRQTNGTGGVDPSGFAVVNAFPFAQPVRLYDEFQRRGGVPANGFPVTRPFVHGGFVTQAMQKSVLQWRPDTGRATFVNVLDELHEAGFDDLLLAAYAVPQQGDFEAQETGLPFQQVAARRLAFLNANAAIRARYYAADDPLLRFGLPTSRVEDLGPLFAIRLQRAVLQQWKTQTPWARAGQAVVANGGDLAKAVGLWPDWAAAPEASPTHSANIVVEQPARGATVQGQFLLQGDARVFEAALSYDLIGEGGEVLAAGHTMARAGAPEFGRFAAEVAFDTGRAQHAVLRVYQPSPRGTGELDYLVAVPLRLQPQGAP